MDIGRADNYKYYEGFEGEPEFTITIPETDDPPAHIWIGYIEDIFDNADLSDGGWKGLTRDYQENTGIFSNGNYTVTDMEEYLNDTMQYKDTDFQYDETSDVLELLIQTFEAALQKGTFVKLEYF